MRTKSSSIIFHHFDIPNYSPRTNTNSANLFRLFYFSQHTIAHLFMLTKCVSDCNLRLKWFELLKFIPFTMCVNRSGIIGGVYLLWRTASETKHFNRTHLLFVCRQRPVYPVCLFFIHSFMLWYNAIIFISLFDFGLEEWNVRTTHPNTIDHVAVQNSKSSRRFWLTNKIFFLHSKTITLFDLLGICDL